MSSIKEAKYLNDIITIEEYRDKVHYQKIFCPECSKAPIHIVRKQKAKPYFASNRKDEHEEDCQYYEEFVKSDRLVRLLESDNKEDQERLNFLVKSNIKAALRLLLKDDEPSKTSNNILYNTRLSKLNLAINPHNFKKESINRVSIRNLRKNEELIESYIIVYGKCELEVKLHHFLDKNTQKKSPQKQLIFRLNKKFVFSIMLSKAQTTHFDLDVGLYTVAFAVFGKLLLSKTFFNLNIETTKNIEIIAL